MRKLSSILIFLVFSLCIFAVPATREPIVRILADGRMDTVYLHGDEYGSYYGKNRKKFLSFAGCTKRHSGNYAAPMYREQAIYVFLCC